MLLITLTHRMPLFCPTQRIGAPVVATTAVLEAFELVAQKNLTMGQCLALVEQVGAAGGKIEL